MNEMINWHEAQPFAAPVTQMTAGGLKSYWLAMVKFGRLEVALAKNGKPMEFAEYAAATDAAATDAAASYIALQLEEAKPLRITIKAYLAVSRDTLKNDICAAYSGLKPGDIALTWNGVDTLQVTTPSLPGGEERLAEELERILQPYRKPAPTKTPVSLKQALAANRRVTTPVASRKAMLIRG